MQRWAKRFSLIMVAALAVSALSACGGAGEKKESSASGGGSSSIDVTLSEWSIKPSSAKAKAGEVTFKVTNKGATVHEMAVLKTDTDPAKLPVAGAGVDEKAVPALGRTANIDAGKSETKAFKLAAGKYVLLCNLPAHFSQGMHTAFTVE